jgi:uncharacterized protein (DUF2336 family)
MLGNPALGVSGLIRDLELHRTLSLLLHDDGARCHTLSVADIVDSQLHQITGAQLAVDG